MKALVYRGPGTKSLEERPTPKLQSPTDAVVRITRTTICGTDLHILKGDVPTCTPGRILGHEYSHCASGGWILGNTIDGTQAECVLIPHADTSLHAIPDGAEADALVMLSDILPTGFECGVQNGKVAPGSTVAIVGAGPIGLAALLTAQFYSPAEIIVVLIEA